MSGGSRMLADRFIWGCYEIKNAVRKRVKKRGTVDEICSGKLCGRTPYSLYETNQYIADRLKGNDPFWVGRMGFIEMDLLRQAIEHRMIPLIDHRQCVLDQLCMNAGFFPNNMEYEERYVDLVLSDAGGIDMQGYWGLYMEDYVRKVYQKRTMITGLSWLEPWRITCDREKGIRPWTAELKGKKVLVVHPFVKSIRQQYGKNREKLFANKYAADDILPEFDLKTVQAVQTIGNEVDSRFDNWFEALEWMEEECSKTDFDVAIVGCGAYGFNLSAAIKRMGKQVIHLGGATQVLFGIRGRRWETEYKDLLGGIMNDYWIRPLEEEKPKNYANIEKGCYW